DLAVEPRAGLDVADPAARHASHDHSRAAAARPAAGPGARAPRLDERPCRAAPGDPLVSTAPLAAAGASALVPPPSTGPSLVEARGAFTRPRLRVSRWAVSLVVSALIVVWQQDFNVDLPAPQNGYVIRASTGMLRDLRSFFYFYYHLGLFPVGAQEAHWLGPSRQDALDFVARHGDKLRMDFGGNWNTPRFGDYGKLFTLWPDAWLRGDPARPSAKPFNQVLFVSSLLAVWWAFWRERRPLLGALIVLLVGSNPFQLYETYNRANI